MIGQDNLLSKLELKSIDNLSQSILLVGPNGCGKHTLVNELISYYKLPLVNITDNLTFDYITTIYLNVNPTFYLIELSNVSEKQQNVVLKLLEEPVKTAHLILITENKSSVINTILNRCVVFEFEPYRPDQLALFVSDEKHVADIVDVCETPGQVKNLNYETLTSIKELSDKIVTRLNNSLALSNALRISDKFNYKDDFDKFDINVFFNILTKKLTEDFIVNKNEHSRQLYSVLTKYKSEMRDSRLNKKNLMDSMVIEMWSI